jgi:hypothetical protein
VNIQCSVVVSLFRNETVRFELNGVVMKVVQSFRDDLEISRVKQNRARRDSWIGDHPVAAGHQLSSLTNSSWEDDCEPALMSSGCDGDFFPV